MKRFLDKNYQKIIDGEIDAKLKKKFKKYALSLPSEKHKIYFQQNFIEENPYKINYKTLNEAFLNKMQVVQKTKSDTYIMSDWINLSLCSLDFYSLTEFRNVYKGAINKLEQFIKTKQS